MKYAIILFLLPILLGGCTQAISNQDIVEATQPDLINYDKQMQKAVAVEMEKNCAVTKLMCKLITDYGMIRDQIRVAKNQKVDLKR